MFFDSNALSQSITQKGVDSAIFLEKRALPAESALSSSQSTGPERPRAIVAVIGAPTPVRVTHESDRL